MIFETHAHYDDERFDQDRVELLGILRSRGISPVINVGASMASTRSSLALAREYDFIYAAVGVHPSETGELTEDDMRELLSYADDSKVAAIGEIGLDYYWGKEPEVQKRQQEWFVRQLDIAEKVNLPVIIHSRDAAEDTLDIMRKASARGIKGVIHCFSYSPEIAEEYIKLGYYIGVGGVVTFKNGKKLKETVQRVPFECILLETDSPYLAPEPFRGSRNDSMYLPYVVHEIARLLEITEDEVIKQTDANARALFTKVDIR